MNWKTILVVYRKELRDQLRDRRTLLSTLIIPAIAMPVLMLGFGAAMNKVFRKAQDEGTSVMIVGSAGAPAFVQALKADPKFRVVPEAPDYEKRIADKKLRVAVKLPEDFDGRLSRGEAT